MNLSTTNNEPMIINNTNEDKNELGQNYTLWYVFSVLSWFLLVACQIESYLSDTKIIYKRIYHVYDIYLPILNLFLLLISMSGLIVYLIFTTCKKNQNLYNGMLGGNSKFHFIFFLFASVLFIIGQILKTNGARIYDANKFIKNCYIADLVFSIFTIFILFFAYTQIKIPCEWYIVLPIKKGTFSSFIPYLLLKIILDIIYLILIKEESVSEDFIKAMIVIFILLLGLISFGISFIFKDIIVAFTNGIIYISLIIYYSLIIEDLKHSLKMVYLVILGIIIIGFALVSFILIALLVLIHKENIFK